MQFKEIPRKLVVSKRLSQCLNPALPTGVHQRALDVYSHILAVLGVRGYIFTSCHPYSRHCAQSEGLHRDLALWSSGLFPFFEYAATSVKVRRHVHDVYSLERNFASAYSFESIRNLLFPPAKWITTNHEIIHTCATPWTGGGNGRVLRQGAFILSLWLPVNLEIARRSWACWIVSLALSRRHSSCKTYGSSC